MRTSSRLTLLLLAAAALLAALVCCSVATADDAVSELSRHLGQTPAETTTHRFARLDLKYYSPPAGRFVRGDIARGEIYYTNSTHLSVAAPLEASERTE